MAHSENYSRADRDDAERPDAIEMLIADHKAVKKLFDRYRVILNDKHADSEKATVVQQICNALNVHVRIEEELFYPTVRQAVDDDSMMDIALIEQAGAKALVAQLQAMHVGDHLFDAKVMVLAEQVTYHAEEEEREMFPEARHAKVDMLALGAEMATRRAVLIAMQEPGKVPHAESRGSDGASMTAR